eukprot:SAG11_NODE_8640_length_985_cov_1.535274_1_plen_20_part_01
MILWSTLRRRQAARQRLEIW